MNTNIKKRHNLACKQLTNCFLLISLATISANLVADNKGVFHVGEDSVAYSAQDMGILKEPGNSFTKSGASVSSKIEPILIQHLADTTDINLIVHLNLRENSNASVAKSADDQIAKVQNQHTIEIEGLSEQLRDINAKYMPIQSFDEQAEQLHSKTINLPMSKQDMADAHRLKQQIDKSKDDLRTNIAAKIQVRSKLTKNEMSVFVLKLGGVVNQYIMSSNILAITLPGDQISRLAAYPLVKSVFLDPDVEYESNTSVPTVFKATSNISNNSSNVWWTNADAGCAFDFGVVDSGVRTDHPGFNGDAYETCGDVIFDGKAGSTVIDGHGTHVTGIAVGRNSTYRGMAPSTETVIWANFGGQSTTMANMDWMVTKSGQKPEVINHSASYGTAITDYNANDSFYDALIETFDVMVITAAGNKGWASSSPTVTHPTPAYNLMAVANMADQNTTTRTDDVRNNSSSVGPTASNRKKPDITAPGTSILSTHSRWDGTGPMGLCTSSSSAPYINCSGTSMAAPHVAGAILLMEDAGVNWPPAQKAVLINTADAWSSNNTSTTSDDGPVDGSHWDKSYGWGYLDMSEARFNRLDYFGSSTQDRVLGRNDNNTPDDYKLYKGFMGSSEKATLVWEKRAGTYNAGTPSTNQRALTDINMRLYRETTGAQLDFDLDGNDNVHQVAPSTSGETVIKVYAFSTNVAGTTYERYALATEENFTRANPPDLWVTESSLVMPPWVGPFQTFDVEIGFFNNGDVAAHSNSVTMSNVSFVSGDGGVAKTIPSIPAKNKKLVTYTLTTTGPPAGILSIPFAGQSNSYAETYHGSGTLNLNVERTPPGTQCTFTGGTSGTYTNSSPLSINWQVADTQTGPDRGLIYVRVPGSANYIFTLLFKNTTGGIENSSFAANSGDGLYQFAIRGFDKGGTGEPFPTSAECSTFLDTKTPTAILNAPTIDFGGSVTSSFQVTDPNPSSGLSFVDFWHRKEGTTGWIYTGQSSNALSGNFSWTPSGGDGRYYLFARPKDNAQNLRPFPSFSNGIGDDSVLYDTTVPIGSIQINNNAITTTSLIVTLNLIATDDNGISAMRFSNDGVSWSVWENYSTLKTNWNLSSFGGNATFANKTAFVQYRDNAGRISIPVSDNIEYGPDADGDGIIDSRDNCINVPNADQRDTNADTFGNICDSDLNNDNIVNALDLNLFRNNFGTNDADADFNGDNIVNALDLNILRNNFGSPPGPSGL